MAAVEVKVRKSRKLVVFGAQTIGGRIFLELDEDETLKMDIDWTDWLDGDTIASQSNEADGPTVSAALATPVATLTISGDGGTIQHRVTTTTGGETKELFIHVNQNETGFDYGTKHLGW